MQLDILNLILRFGHIFAAMAAAGGAIFARFALLPSLPELDEATRKTFHDAVRRRWSRVVMISIAVLLISGLVNFVLFFGQYKVWGETWRAAYVALYHGLFGIKFILALGIFFIASALAGKAAGLQKIRDNAKFWLNVNIALIAVVVLISGIMRQTHNGPSPTKTQAVEYVPAKAP